MKNFLLMLAAQLQLPIAIFAVAKSSNYFFHNDWVTVIAVLAATIAAIIYKANTLEDTSDSKSVLKQMLIVLTGTVLALPRILFENQHPNHFGTIHLAIAFGLAAIFFIYMLKVDLFKRLKYRSRDMVKNIEFSWLTTSATVYAAIWLLSQAYIHFGTQFVWLPMISLTAMLSLCFFDEDLRLENSFLTIIAFPAAIAFVSTFYQFWFSETVFGCPLWFASAAILFTIVVVIAIIIGVGYCNDRKISKLQKIKEKEESIRIDHEEKEAKSTIVEILKKEAPSWKDIIYIWRKSKNKISDLHKLDLNVTKNSLLELVEVSEKKNQIFWDDQLTTALEILEEITKATRSDHLLKAIEGQYNELFDLQNNSKFEGHNSLAQIILKHKTMKELFWPK